MKRYLSIVIVVAVGQLAGCTRHILNANLTRDDLEYQVQSHFREGASYADVNKELSRLGVPEGDRWTYAAQPPRAMVARLNPPGGVWVDEPDQIVQWWDLTFMFDRRDTLTSIAAKHGEVRYVNGLAFPAEPGEPPRRFPQRPLPPREPPGGERIVLPWAGLGDEPLMTGGGH